MISMAVWFVRLLFVQCDADEGGCIPYQLWMVSPSIDGSLLGPLINCELLPADAPRVLKGT